MDENTLGIIIATFLGPVAAVLVTRTVDRLHDRERRRLEVFRELMRSRRMALSQDHVRALNLVEIEFHRDKKVMDAMKALMSQFETGYGANKTLEELNAANERTEALRTALLSAIARTLKYNFEQMEILRGGYTPQGWAAEIDEQTVIRQGLAAVFKGRLSIPITVTTPPGNAVAQTPTQPVSPFPPKPN